MAASTAHPRNRSRTIEDNIRDTHSTLYKPLNHQDHEIRILRILPAGFQEPIKASLRHVSINKNPKYIALSYTWGTDRERRIISVNESQFQVTENLFQALLHLRDRTSTVDLWVDAVCINQEDPDERATEVVRMTDIFGNADQVHAWLGLGEDDDVLAIEHIENLFTKVHGKITDLGDDYGQVVLEMVINKKYEEEAFVKCSIRVLLAMARLFRSAWWTRLWVTQEPSLAAVQNSIVRYGDQIIPWPPLVSMSFLFYQNFYFVTGRLGDLLDTGTARNLVHGIRMLGTQRASRQPRAPFHLTYLLLHNNFAEAKDPRDHIYALLGIAGDAKSISIQPTYAENVQKVYRDCFERIVRSTKCLDAICHRTSSAFCEDYTRPSWVPRWHDRSDFATSIFPICMPKRFLEGDDIDGVLKLMGYNASGSRLSRVTFDGDTMIVASIIIGTVLHLSDINENPPEYKALNIHITDERFLTSDTFEKWKVFVFRGSRGSAHDLVLNKYGAQKLPEVFYRTMIADKDIWWRSPDAISTSGTEGVDHECGINVQPLALPNHYLDMPIEQYVKRLPMITKRRLAVLDSGHFGIVPNHCVEGDKAMIMLGCSVPVIVRFGENGKARLVGESYFHGVMFGEALEEENIEDITLI